MHLAAGNYHDAERAFYAGLAAGESRFYLKIAHGWGQALHALGRLDEAEDVFAKLCGMRPDLLDPLLWRARCRLDLGDPEGALALHERALAEFEAHADAVRVWADGAVALDKLGRFADGAAWCQRGLASMAQRGRQDATLVLNLATFQLRSGDRAAARQTLREARKLGQIAAARAEGVWQDWGDGSAL